MGKFFGMIVSVCLLVALFLLITSDIFEKEPPTFVSEDKIYWNLKDDINIEIKDNTGILNYKILYTFGNEEHLIESVSPQDKPTSIDLNVAPKNGDLLAKNSMFKIKIIANDISRWNMLEGNVAQKEIEVIIDRAKPKISLISKAYGVSRGGSATAVVGIEDENLDQFYVETESGQYTLFPFEKDGYYAFIIPWNILEDNFSPKVIATDKAGNKSVVSLDYYKKNIAYRTSTIPLQDSFLDGKISELTLEIGKEPDSDKIVRFKYINEELRDKNAKEIYTVSKNSLLENKNFNITPFYPLKNGAKVADYGDYRTFTKDNNIVSNSYHLGIDFASTANAPIVATNRGVVIYSDFNGIYGNTLILDHGMGVSSLYSHCSEFKKLKGDVVEAGEVIALSGMSGLALGDHLHFGVIIQGVEVRPQEWMDQDWLQKNIIDVFSEGKQAILNKGSTAK